MGSRSDAAGLCGQGSYCPAGTSLATQYQCAAGTWSDRTNLTSAAECYDCTLGNYCIVGAVAPEPCLAGSYANVTRTRSPQRTGAALPAECAICPAGYACGPGTVHPAPCSAGTYSAAGSGACMVCPAGYACDAAALTDSAMLTFKGCAAGLFCPTGTTVAPSPATHACPLGNECPFATPNPQTCDPGTYANVTGLAACLVTPAAYYSLEGAVQPTGQCDPGYYCPAGSSSSKQVPCAGGTYFPAYGARAQADCLTCVNGTHCPPGTAAPITTPLGSYSEAGAAAATLCPTGRFGNITGARSELECAECLPGFYCDRRGLTVPTGKCAAGYYCTRASPISAPGTLPIAEAPWVARLGFYGSIW